MWDFLGGGTTSAPEMVPTDSGDWIGGGQLYSQGDYDTSSDYQPIYDDSYLYGGEPDDTVTLYSGPNLAPIEYDRVTGQEVHFTADDWYRETFRSEGDLIERYGIDNLDILYALDSEGYIDEHDWDTWRELYGAMFGG